MLRAKIARCLAVAVIVAGGAAVAAPSPASAYIDRCNEFNNQTWASGYCWGTAPSTFYVHIVCRTVYNYEYPREGPGRWAGGGVTSVAYCNTGDYRIDTEVYVRP